MAGVTVFWQLSRLKGVSLTLHKEDIMPSANRMMTPVMVNEAQIEGRYAHLGGYTPAWGPPAADDGSGGSLRVYLHPVPGGLWLIGPEGAAVPLRALRGYGYLRELLRRAGQPVAALDLVGPVREPPWNQDSATSSTPVPSGPTGNGCATSSSRSLRPRTGPTSAGWARCGQNATRFCMSSPGIDGPLGRHLQTRIHTGLNCRYEPDPADGLDWVLDGRPTGI